MHLKRWITGLILMPVLFSIIYFSGEYGFFFILSVVSIIALYEYFTIVFPKEIRESSFIKSIITLSYGMTPVFFWSHLSGSSHASMILLSLNVIIGSLLLFFKFGVTKDLLDAFLKQVIGMVYIPCFLSFFILIRGHEDGVLWIFLIFCIIAAGDTGALYTGTFLGKHKLCPTVSPKKTIEGSIGGLVSNMTIGVGFCCFLLPELGYISVIGFSLLIGAIGQLGDLFESSLKRAADVKDSGTILPGHGGILDRIDALIFVAPLAYFLKNLIF